jgi:hypothetical protein
MHTRSGGQQADERAVVPFEQARAFLSTHIRDHERLDDPDDAEDLAEEFLDFIKTRAGLLL